MARRIVHELHELESALEGFRPLRLANDFSWVSVRLQGPTGSPYEKGDLVVTVSFSNYPVEAPKIHFETKMWHLNVCQFTGYVNLQKLHNWEQNTTLLQIFRELASLLIVPNEELARDYWVEKMYRQNAEMYNSTAAVWCRWYANGTLCYPEYEEKLFHLVREGASIEESIVFITDACWDVSRALRSLRNVT